MQQWFHKRSVLLAMAIGLILLSLLYIVYGLYVPSNCDGYFRWQESAYVLRGIDPFEIVTGHELPIDGIGPLDANNGNMPWTYLLSNLIYPGFLPYSSALLWARAVFVVLLAVAIACVWHYLGREFDASRLQKLVLTSVLFASYMWFATLRLGNHTAYLMLLLLILLTFDHNKHWMPAGLIYTFLLMKPQTTSLFLLLFLLDKRFKPILFAGGLLAALTLATSAITGSTPFQMLSSTYQLCVGYENLDNYIYYGLLDPLVSVFHVSSSIVLPIGVVLGAGTLMLYKLRWNIQNETIHYAVAALLSMCWMYIQPNDMILFGLVGIACLAKLFFSAMSRAEACVFAFGGLLGAVPILGTFYMASPIVPLVVRLAYFVIVGMLIKSELKSKPVQDASLWSQCRSQEHRE